MNPLAGTILAAFAMTAAGADGALALATPPPAPVGAAPSAWAAAPPGICLLGRDSAIGASTAGAAANLRLQQLGGAAKAELTREEAAIRAEEQALRAQGPTLAPAVAQKRVAVLQRRAQAFQPRAVAKNDQLTRTRNIVVGKINREIEAILPTLAPAHGCAVVFERAATYGANPAMDLTAEVVKALNTRLPSVSVELAPASP